MQQVLLIFLMFSMTSTYSQKDDFESNIKNTINTFFEGLHNGDTILLKRVISKDLILQTTFVNKEGKSVLRTETKNDFLGAVSRKDSATVWFEKLLSFTIKIDENLASVWTPYEFYLNDNFSHCGVNYFQLFNNSGNWKIIYIIDTRKRQGCNSSD